jgi:hypothetical protein
MMLPGAIAGVAAAFGLERFSTLQHMQDDASYQSRMDIAQMRIVTRIVQHETFAHRLRRD